MKIFKNIMCKQVRLNSIYAFLAIFIAPVFSHAQSIQQSNWLQFVANSNLKNVDFRYGTPVNGYNIPQPLNENGQPLTAYKGINAAFDASSNLVFAVIETNQAAYVYDNAMRLAYYFPFVPITSHTQPSRQYNGTKQIPIIKTSCGQAYHFLIGSKWMEFNVGLNSVFPLSIDNTSGIYTLGSIGTVNINSTGLLKQDIMVAFRKIDEYQYAVYSVEGNDAGSSNSSIRKLKHQVVNSNLNYNGPAIGVFSESTLSFSQGGAVQIYDSEFNEYLSELEVSPDGRFIAFADNNKIFVFNLNNDGTIGSNKPLYSFSTNNSTTARIAGLEFSSDGNKLVFTRFNPSTIDPQISDAVGVMDMQTNNVIYIPNTSDFARSTIELGRDNQLYITKPTELHRINLTTNQISFVYGNTVFSNNTEIVSGNTDYSIRPLPDQNDGSDNSSGYNMQINSLTVSNNQTWSKGVSNNPFMVDKEIHISTMLTVNGTLTLNELDLRFFTNAKLKVNSGGKLIINGANLTAENCGYLWEGIEVAYGGQILINQNYDPTNPTLTIPSTISDAKQAILFSGQMPFVVKNTTFIRNVEAIKLTQYTALNNTIAYNTFNLSAQVGLQLQNGSPILGLKDAGFYYPIGAINAVYGNSGSTLNITNNVIQGGQYGIKLAHTNALVKNNTIKLMAKFNGTAISSTTMTARNTIVKIENNTIENVNKGIVANKGHKEIQVNGNSIHFARQNGIEITNNVNVSTINVNNNTLNYCAGNAVLLSANASKDGNVVIKENNITGGGLTTNNGQGSVFTYTGIALLEPTKASLKTFNSVLIRDNVLNKVWYGVKVSNLADVNAQPNRNPYGIEVIQYNTINYVAATKNQYNLNPQTNSGIDLTTSFGINALSNTITSNLPTSVLNNGIVSKNTAATLIRANTIEAGTGLNANGSSLNNNYLCNSFNKGVKGIYLLNHYMRNNWQSSIPTRNIHGENNITRPNTFNTTLSKRIHLETSPSSTTQMSSMIKQNQWLFNSTPPVVTYTPLPWGGTPSRIPQINTRASDGCALEMLMLDSIMGVGPIDEGEDYNPVSTWQMNYAYEREQYNNGITSNIWMHNLIELEDAMAQQNWADAQAKFSALPPNNIIDKKLLQVYGIYINYGILTQNEDSILITPSELIDLDAIAQLNPLENGNGVYAARDFMYVLTGKLYAQPMGEVEQIMVVKINFNACSDTLPITPNQVKLVNANNEIIDDVIIGLDEYGYAFVTAEQLAAINEDVLLGFAIQTNEGNLIYSNFKTKSAWYTEPEEQVTICQLGKKASTNLPKQVSSQNKVFLYPNPSEGNVTINGLKSGFVHVYTLQGKPVKTLPINNGLLDFGTLPNSLYIVHVYDTQGNHLTTVKHLLSK